MTVQEFAAKRRRDQDLAIESLTRLAELFISDLSTDRQDALTDAALELYVATYMAEGGTETANVRAMTRMLRSTYEKTTTDSNPDTLATLIAVMVTNAATAEAASEAGEPMLLEWVTMHDEDVRPSHDEVDGQRRRPGERFIVGGYGLQYPGQPIGDPSVWINCRCVLAPIAVSAAASLIAGSVTEQGEDMDDQSVAVPWYGVLAPEGKWSGDGRMFAEESLTYRDLPMPLTWQKVTDNGHDGSVTVAKIEQITRVDGEMRGAGTFLMSAEADEVVGLIAEFGKFGVSVDADDAEFTFDEESGKVTFTAARIASASIVAIPAFAEAFVSLGDAPPDFLGDKAKEDDVCDENSDAYDAEACAEKQQADKDAGMAEIVEVFISEESWDGSAGRFTPQQWKASCILHVCDGDEKSCHKLPIKEPGGALSRAGVHAAAARFNQVQAPDEAKSRAKASLRGAYKQLGEEGPDWLKASGEVITYNGDPEDFKRGPGWITHPADTKRIHDYWTKPGKEGYAKIAWGQPGDFNRCRVLVGEKIATNSPEDTRFLNQICARWHKDALGIWPGEHHSLERDGEMAPAVELVASAATKAPAAWFANPEFTGPTHLTVTDEGRVFGHIAEWTTCHIGYDGVCVSPPHSSTDYAYFATGQVLLDNGSSARTGVLSLGGGHAGGGLRPRAAAEHYDSTSCGVADVAVGEDEWGIWCAGWIRPGTTDEQIIALRASDVSGDWREFGPGQMEMVAALAVNVGGFPVVHINDGRQVALVAAGVVPSTTKNPVEELAAAIIARLDAREARKAKVAALTNRIKERTDDGVQLRG